METNILNIAEILKDKPKGTKLYNLLCGDCWLITADYKGDEFGKEFPIVVSRDKDDGVSAGKTISFTSQGTIFNDAVECLLYPSKAMPDWEKLALKVGDILTDGLGTTVLFNGWAADDYSQINTKYTIYHKKGAPYDYGEDEIFSTEYFVKVNETEKREFISELEKEYDGKLNLETLEIEDKQTFLSNVSKTGKKWDAETKQIEDLPKKHEFKPFERVLIRDYDDDEWCASFFSHYADKEKTQAITVNDYGSQQCIPYEGNEHLLGTTNSPK